MRRFVGVVALLAAACAGPELELDEIADPEVTDQMGPLHDPETLRMRDACRDLMERSGIYPSSRCPVGPSDPGDLQLPLGGQAGCLRDAYVFTALAYCWRSQCLEDAGVTEGDVEAGQAPSSPMTEAREAARMLTAAELLCTGGSEATHSCTTAALLSCP
jgi:hypothetical protein